MRKTSLALVVARRWRYSLRRGASAITYGKADGSRHPNVGTFGKRTYPYCSGALISRTVFLTAAHCEISKKQVEVTFDEKYTPGSRVYTGTFHTRSTGAANAPYDIAVVVEDGPIGGIDPVRPPTLNRLNDLPKDNRFTPVGYGSQE
jgi:hypothetical protein